MTLVLQDHQATIAWRDRQVAIEYRWVNEAADHDRDPARPIMVFLHEGLGSVAMWKDFPQALCQACGLKGLVYSRPGYGASTPRAADELWTNDFMHHQAHEVFLLCSMSWEFHNLWCCLATAMAARLLFFLQQVTPNVLLPPWLLHLTCLWKTCRWPASHKPNWRMNQAP